MLKQQPLYVQRFLYIVAGGAFALLVALLLALGEPSEWTPAASLSDDTLIPVDDPSPPHYTPGTLTKRPLETLPPAPPAPPYSLRWRAGVGVPDGSLAYFDWPAERPGWYLNWSTNFRTEPIFLGIGRRAVMDLPAPAFAMEFTPMVRLKNGRLYPGPQELSELAQHHPGLTWLIGNEPDVRWQDNTPPEVYAIAYHRAYHAIKSADPTAQVAIGGVSQVTPLRLEYLNRVWEFYRSLYGVEMPVDIWTMHAFVLREERNAWGVNIPPGFLIEQRGELWEIDDHDDLTLVERQVRAMRDWMAARGQRNKPLWITEYGILMPAEYGFNTQGVITFLEGSFALFLSLRDVETGLPEDDNRLVQRWNWYSARDSRYPTGNLFDNYGRLTPVGEAYQQLLRQSP